MTDPELQARELIVGDAGPEDLRTAARWLEEHYGALNREIDVRWPGGFFPQTGVAVRHGGKTLVVIPVYLEATSRVAVAGHFTAAPGLPPRLLRLAALAAVRGCQDFARRHGRSFLIAIWGRRSVCRIAAKAGFQNGDNVCEQLWFPQTVNRIHTGEKENG